MPQGSTRRYLASPRSTATHGNAVCVASSSLCTSDATCGAAAVCIDTEGAGQKACVKLAQLADGNVACKPGGCSAGEDCQGAVYGAALYAKCRTSCDAQRACPDDFACVPSTEDIRQAGWVCLKRCAPSHPRCSAGQGCGSDEGNETVCLLSPPIDPTAAEEWSGVFSEPPAARPRARFSVFRKLGD